MAYVSSTFILPTDPSDKRILLRDSTLVRVGGFNVCQFQKAMTDGLEVWINLRDLKIVLGFSTSKDAKIALQNLETEIESLLPNCAINGSGMTPFTELFTTVANTWYPITHSLNTLDFTYQAREGNNDISLDLERVDVNNIRIRTTSVVTGSITLIAV